MHLFEYYKGLYMRALILGSLCLSLCSLSLADTSTSTANTPLEAVLAVNNVVSQTELANVTITQTLNRVEGADQATVTLIESNLLDDSIAAIKTVFFLARNEAHWTIEQTHQFQQCRRGPMTDRFTQKRCF